MFGHSILWCVTKLTHPTGVESSIYTLDTKQCGKGILLNYTFRFDVADPVDHGEVVALQAVQNVCCHGPFL